MLGYGEEEEAILTFHEQADGRKAARLLGGKVVLVHYDHINDVKDGERWKVRLQHRPMVAVAFPLEKVPVAPGDAEPGRLPRPTQTLAEAATMPHQLRTRVTGPKTEIIMPPPARPATPASSAAAPAPAPVSPSPPTVTATPVVATVTAVPNAVIKETDSVALFIDGANTDGACRDAGYFLDFAKARRYLLGKGRFYAGFYFVADFTSQDPLQQKFLDFLSHNGYVVRKKAVKAIRDEETGETVYKSNVDVDLAVELLNTQDNYDVAYLFSGDSDYERVVDILRSRGKRVYVVSARASLSRELAYVADKPIFYLEDHRREMEREDRQPVP